ncbi:MAG: protein kinase domain-containing protein [Thermoleophilaceae bacterium]
MSRPDATAVPDGEPTVRLGPRRARERVVLGRYRLDSRLGSGGFGVVWRAHDLRLERDVAVKVIARATGESEQARTEREALAAARLNHPGIVALYEFGHDDDDIYLVSELVVGATLAELEAEGAVSDRDVARIGLALCDALEHAHARGVIHRDVKPANVMVLAEPAAGSGFAKLTDLGIAHVASAGDLTATGDVVGTLAYMAPEQAEGRRVTAAADVYSMALVLYEAWTGTNPVRAQSPAATARRVGLAFPPLRALRPDLAPELAEVLDAALDADPVYRPVPADLREVLAEAEGDLSDAGGLVEPETLERFGLTAVRTRTRLRTLVHRGVGAAAPQAVEPWAPRRGRRFLVRASAAFGASALVLAGLGLGSTPAFSPVVAAGAAAVAVGLLPRLGWFMTACAFLAWLATGGGQPGTALLVAAALGPTPVLMPRAGHLWSLPALAPLLGAAALGPLFVGLAALASTAWRRAGLAAAGLLWLTVAEQVIGRDLLFGPVPGTAARGVWQGSVVRAAEDALWPLISSAALAPAAIWVGFALVLPVLARGRLAALDLGIAVVWTIGLVAAHQYVSELLATGGDLQPARGAVAGAALGALVAVSAILLTPHPRDSLPDPPLP